MVFSERKLEVGLGLSHLKREDFAVGIRQEPFLLIFNLHFNFIFFVSLRNKAGEVGEKESAQVVALSRAQPCGLRGRKMQCGRRGREDFISHTR